MKNGRHSNSSNSNGNSNRSLSTNNSNSSSNSKSNSSINSDNGSTSQFEHLVMMMMKSGRQGMVKGGPPRADAIDDFMSWAKAPSNDYVPHDEVAIMYQQLLRMYHTIQATIMYPIPYHTIQATIMYQQLLRTYVYIRCV